MAARFIDYERMEVDWPGGVIAGFPAEEGLFSGTAQVETSSNLDGLRHYSTAIQLTLDVREYLTPRLDSLQNEVIFVNDPVVAHGDGFLLGGAERDVARHRNLASRHRVAGLLEFFLIERALDPDVGV